MDNHSTVDVFCNGKLLKNIHKIRRPLTIILTGRVTTTNWTGYLDEYGWVWYYPKGIANILLLVKVKNKFCVKFDSDTHNHFHAHMSSNKVRSFIQS